MSKTDTNYDALIREFGAVPVRPTRIGEDYYVIGQDLQKRLEAALRHLSADNARLREALAIEREDNERRAAERELILHDKDINNIAQRRLETGEWLLGQRGFVRSRQAIQKNDRV